MLLISWFELSSLFNFCVILRFKIKDTLHNERAKVTLSFHKSKNIAIVICQDILSVSLQNTSLYAYLFCFFENPQYTFLFPFVKCFLVLILYKKTLLRVLKGLAKSIF